MATAAPAGVVEREPALPQTTIDTGHADMIVRCLPGPSRGAFSLLKLSKAPQHLRCFLFNRLAVRLGVLC